jgi:hypothetical protein
MFEPKPDSPAVMVIKPVEQADDIAKVVATELAYQLEPLAERIAFLERAIAELQDRA